MPMLTTCADHPDFTGQVYQDNRDHLAAHHDGLSVTKAERQGVLVTRFVEQAAAQGVATGREFYCVCGSMVRVAPEDTDHPLSRCRPCQDRYDKEHA